MLGGSPHHAATTPDAPQRIETDGIVNRDLSQKEFVAIYGNRLDAQARQLKTLEEARAVNPEVQSKLDALAAENQAMRTDGAHTIDALTQENSSLRGELVRAQSAPPPPSPTSGVRREASTPSGSPLSPNLSAPDAAALPTTAERQVTEIDAKAVTALSGTDRALATAPARQPTVSRGGGVGARTGERLLAVLLPAHVDAAGILHDAATVHVVVEAPGWRLEPARPDADSQSFPEFSRSSAPSSLREAVAGASAPAIEGLETLPARAPHMITVDTPAPPGTASAPTAAAIAAARSGHRIAELAKSPAGPATAPVAALPRGKTIVPSGDPSAAMARVRGLAAPMVPRPAKPSGGTHPETDLGDPFGAIPGQEKQP